MNWKRVLRYSGFAILALVIVAIATACVIVRTNWFRQFVVAQVEQKADAATGGALNITSIAIDWRMLSVDFYGITLRGREAASQPPLFAAEHLRVGLKVISIFRRDVDLNEIVLDQPSAHINVDAQGNSNLPNSPAREQSSSSPGIFDMAIQRVEVNSGQIYYNDRETPLSAELRDFRARVNFDRLGSHYRGDIAYRDGQVTMEDFKPLAHSLQLKFTAGRSGAVIEPVTIAAGKSTLTAHAKLTGYQNLSVDGTYEGLISTAELARIMKNPSLPDGDVALNGSLRYQSSPNRPPIQNIYLDGHLNSRELDARVGAMAARATSIRADYRLQDGNLSVKSFEAGLLGGSVRGSYELRDLSGNTSSQLAASLRDVSLDALTGAAAVKNRNVARLSGRANGTVSAGWGSTIQNLTVRTHVEIRSASVTSAAARGPAIPVDGLIDMNYDHARNVAAFGRSNLRTGNTTVSINGTLGDRSELNAQVETGDLHEAAELVSTFENASLSSGQTAAPLPVDLRGSARFEGQVLGSLQRPRIKGQLTADNLEVDKSRWRSLQVGLDASPSEVTLQHGALTGVQIGRANFSGRVDLNNWSLTPASPISLQITATQISVADLQTLARSHYPVTGTLDANISAHGSRESPEGQGHVQLSEASAWNERIENLSIDFQGDGNSIHTNAKLQIPAGNLTANFTYMPKTQGYEAALQASGIKLEQIQAVQNRDIGIGGDLTLSASGRGTLNDPQLNANIQIPQLRIRDQIVSDIQTQLNIASRHADFTLSSKADQGSIQAKGNLQLDGEYPATAAIDIRAIPVGVVLASYLPKDEKIQGTAELHADLSGPLKDPTAIVAHLEIPTLSLAYESVQLALVRPLHLNYANGVATLDRTELKGTGTDLTLQGVIPVKSSAPLNVSANGTIDLSLAEGFAPGVQSSGQIQLEVGAHGDLSRPTMEGKVRLVNAFVSTQTVPVSMEGINGEFQISGNRIEIEQFSGAAGGGTVSASGVMTYGEQPTFNIGVDLKSVRVRYPAGIRSILSGHVALNGTSAGSNLTGRVLIDRLSFTQQFDLANFMAQFSSEAPASAPSPLEQRMKLNVVVATADNLNLTSSKVSIGGAANLTVSGTMADPVVLGRMTLSSGEIFFLGKRYEIQSGTIDFANPVRTTPVLNLYAQTTVQQYNITLNFIGPVDRLRTNYTSDPPLPPADIINLIAFGQTAAQQATNASTPATLGAESVLAQGAASQVAGKIENLTGISQLTIDPLAQNSQSNSATQVALQERITGSILLTFSTDVTSTENQAIQVQYKIKKNLSVSVLRDEYGGYAADIQIHKTF